MNYRCQNSEFCSELQCNNACPEYVQFSYLLERNEVEANGRCESMTEKEIDKNLEIIDKLNKYGSDYSGDPLGSIVTKRSTIDTAKQLAYCAAWTNWKGSQLHCTVYSLNFSQYIESMKQSWSREGNADENIEYVKIWADTCKVLIISGFDFVYFKQFQSEIFLSLIQSRLQKRLTTIIVSPPPSTLAGEGPFFARICDIIKNNKVG